MSTFYILGIAYFYSMCFNSLTGLIITVSLPSGRYTVSDTCVTKLRIVVFSYLTNLFGSMYIYITHLKARSKTARYERDSLKSSHARHLPASNYMIICTVIYLYTHSIHIRTLTDKAHRDGLHTQTGYTQTLKGHFPSQSPRTRDFIM